MSAQAILEELETLGNAQNRTIYARHGVGSNQYGVSYADLKTLKKRLKTNHTLTIELWNSGNHDARVLATMIADPQQLDAETIDAWAGDLQNYVLSDAFANLISQTAHMQPYMEQWTCSDDEWIGRVGWQLLAHLAIHDQNLPDAYFETYLDTIKRDIHTRKNRVRDAINNALISIGMRNDYLETQALEVAAYIGKVDVDHGQTSCKTPDAADYIRKGRQRQQQKGKTTHKRSK